MDWKRVVSEQAALIEKLRTEIVELKEEIAILKNTPATLPNRPPRTSSNLLKIQTDDAKNETAEHKKDIKNTPEHPSTKNNSTTSSKSNSNTVPNEDHLHSDETGHKHHGHRYWTWCLLAKRYTVFHIDSTRSSIVLENLLGQVPPTTSVRPKIKDGIENFSHVGHARSSAGVAGNHRLNDFPLGMGQVGSVRFSDVNWCFHCMFSMKGHSERLVRTQENNIFLQNALYQYLH